MPDGGFGHAVTGALAGLAAAPPKGHMQRQCRRANRRFDSTKAPNSMHSHSLDSFRHSHDFLGADHARNERRSWMVIALCTAMMVLEIGGGFIFGSMALIADGLHMSTHAVAFLIAALGL